LSQGHGASRTMIVASEDDNCRSTISACDESRPLMVTLPPPGRLFQSQAATSVAVGVGGQSLGH
ncbi:hypothetical protein, partial [Agrobacterium tumefaciens]|uniref:hypothetical protein n=1 Tax=Agrobacterium tumefaciens TaxID=358 RepID=UPI0019D51861